jgi:hypothetical protein
VAIVDRLRRSRRQRSGVGRGGVTRVYVFHGPLGALVADIIRGADPRPSRTIVPSSVTFTKPQAAEKSESFVSRAMVEDLGAPPKRFRQNVERRFWHGSAR